MSEENARKIFECFDIVENYMKSIKTRTDAGNYVLICNAKVRTAFRGCVMNIKSFRNLYDELIMGNKVTHIPTHDLSQDHLEVSIINFLLILIF